MLREVQIRSSGKGKDQGSLKGQPFLRHVRAVGGISLRENGQEFGLLTLGQGVLVSVTRSPRSIGSSSVPGSGSTLAARSVLRECGLAEQIARQMCCVWTARQFNACAFITALHKIDTCSTLCIVAVVQESLRALSWTGSIS